jgi:CHAT domain-containing protein
LRLSQNQAIFESNEAVPKLQFLEQAQIIHLSPQGGNRLRKFNRSFLLNAGEHFY